MSSATVPVERSQEYRLLLEAFDSFTHASAKLESAYSELQTQLRELQLELEEKNRQLEQNLAEKERVKSWLDGILQSLPCGVLVTGAAGEVTLRNQRAVEVFGDTASPPDLPGADTEEREITLHRSSGPLHLLVRSIPAGSGRIMILTDITRLKLLEEENRRGERLRVVGAMSCQLAHEIRNPLGSIELNAAMIEKSAPAGSDDRRLATSILTAVRSLNMTLTNMLSFSKTVAPRFERVPLGALVEGCVELLSPVLEQRGVTPLKRFNGNGIQVQGDPELLRQMLLNLILNAVQAMPRGGTLTLEVDAHTTAPHEPRVLLSVGDTGRGIPPENLPRVFDPFFTTNRNGNGLGLSIVHSIVEKHGGAIGIESRQGEGTTFRVSLPACRRE